MLLLVRGVVSRQVSLPWEKTPFLECVLGESIFQIYIYRMHVKMLDELHNNRSTSKGQGSLPNDFHCMRHTRQEGPSGVVSMIVLNVQNSYSGSNSEDWVCMF